MKHSVLFHVFVKYRHVDRLVLSVKSVDSVTSAVDTTSLASVAFSQSGTFTDSYERISEQVEHLRTASVGNHRRTTTASSMERSIEEERLTSMPPSPVPEIHLNDDSFLESEDSKKSTGETLLQLAHLVVALLNFDTETNWNFQEVSTEDTRLDIDLLV